MSRLHSVQDAEGLARALSGHRCGTGWTARCPAHDDREPSLSIRDTKQGRLLVHCHAGCTQIDVIAALRDRGLWPRTGASGLLRRPPAAIPDNSSESNDIARTEAALIIWRRAIEATGTLAETYLRSRDLSVPVPSALRFHPGLRHPTGGVWPAMVALVARGTDGAPIAIHRTFLAPDGTSKAPVKPQKMMLGPCRGGAVRLAEPGDLLMIGEGIETCIAAMQASGHPTWAALSTSGLRTLDLPGIVRDVVVLADGDDPGEAAARDCARRWKREGRRVRIARPPLGTDFNDLLIGPSPALESMGNEC